MAWCQGLACPSWGFKTDPHETEEDNFYPISRTDTRPRRYCKTCDGKVNKIKNKGTNKEKYSHLINNKYPKDLNCVYHHIDPETQEVKYIGEGKIDRAFSVTNRSVEHAEWLINVFREHNPTDIVKIQALNLTKKESKKLETEMVLSYGLENLLNKI